MVDAPLCPNCRKSLIDNLGFEIVDSKKVWTVKKSNRTAILREVKKKYTNPKVGETKVINKKKRIVETEVNIEEPLRIFFCKSCGYPIHLVSDFDRCNY